jgi:hypothetical protein
VLAEGGDDAKVLHQFPNGTQVVRDAVGKELAGLDEEAKASSKVALR